MQQNFHTDGQPAVNLVIRQVVQSEQPLHNQVDQADVDHGSSPDAQTNERFMTSG